MNRKTTNRLPLYRVLWCKIRCFQQLNEISDEALANALGVHVRTLNEYDKTAENVNLWQARQLFIYKQFDSE